VVENVKKVLFSDKLNVVQKLNYIHPIIILLFSLNVIICKPNIMISFLFYKCILNFKIIWKLRDRMPYDTLLYVIHCRTIDHTLDSLNCPDTLISKKLSIPVVIRRPITCFNGNQSFVFRFVSVFLMIKTVSVVTANILSLGLYPRRSNFVTFVAYYEKKKVI